MKNLKVIGLVIGAIIVVVAIAYLAGVRVWVTDTAQHAEAAMNPSALEAGAGTVSVGVGGGWTVGAGINRSLHICMGCTPTDFSQYTPSADTTNYKSAADETRQQTDMETGQGGSGYSGEGGNSSGDDSSGDGSDDSGSDSSGAGSNSWLHNLVDWF